MATPWSSGALLGLDHLTLTGGSADLSGTDLTNVDLSQAQLQGIDLTEARLAAPCSSMR